MGGNNRNDRSTFEDKQVRRRLVRLMSQHEEGTGTNYWPKAGTHAVTSKAMQKVRGTNQITEEEVDMRQDRPRPE